MPALSAQVGDNVTEVKFIQDKKKSVQSKAHKMPSMILGGN